MLSRQREIFSDLSSKSIRLRPPPPSFLYFFLFFNFSRRLRITQIVDMPKKDSFLLNQLKKKNDDVFLFLIKNQLNYAITEAYRAALYQIFTNLSQRPAGSADEPVVKTLNICPAKLVQSYGFKMTISKKSGGGPYR